ncbi:hypothetical protein TNCV_395131 [Trichonephila clavipes]|nr:hypothetical protein TNCV_395131 [Trichonephila clavipes]
MGKEHSLSMAIFGYRTSVENVDLSPSVQHNASSDDYSRTTVTVFFRDVTGMESCPDISPNQLTLRIASGTATNLIRITDTTSLT